MRKKKATSTLLTDSALSLTDLKTRSMQELMDLAEQYEIENASSMRKQELIFALLSTCASQNGSIYGDGVLEILPDGFGFLRSPLCSYMPGPDDIYVSPSRPFIPTASSSWKMAKKISPTASSTSWRPLAVGSAA